MEDDGIRERAVESLVAERRRSSLVGAFVVASLVLIVIWGATGAGYFWPVWPILVGLVALGAGALARGWSDRTFGETTIRQRMAHLSGQAPPGVQR